MVAYPGRVMNGAYLFTVLVCSSEGPRDYLLMEIEEVTP
jgi:hypothetical protein